MSDLIRFEGTVAEHHFRNLIKDDKKRICSPDWLQLLDDEIMFHECKFKSDKVGQKTKNKPKWVEGGHGMEKYQFDNYLKIYYKYKIKTKLWVYDQSDKNVYWQYIHVLGEVIDDNRWIFQSAKDDHIIIAWSINEFNVMEGWT